jgi:subtilisin-like proprotein convertase family protein
VNRTFTSNGLITIPAGAPGTTEGPATPYPSIIQVAGLRAGRILDVNATLNGYSHTFTPDVQVMLVAPNGRTSVTLMNVAGDGTVTNLTLIFDDQAAVFLPFDAPLLSGTFKPTTPPVAPSPEAATLRAFNGLNPNGAWRLYVADNVGGDTGSITGWSLTIRARVTVPHRHRRRANQRQRPTRRAKR